ncbi:cysteine-rich KTR domain-containing protein [Bifidobacterium catenulatum]|uniref:cysteine-rich KTR domain-containing protein n=2 Tax=Bifidobacterium catenulatum TaxID=1686 RepID=UPI003D2F1D37
MSKTKLNERQKVENSVKLNRNVNMPYGKKRKRLNIGGDKMIIDEQWIYCPVCSNKTRIKVRYNAELKNFPLFCPKCKQENLIDAKGFQIIVIKEPDAKTQSR